MSFPQSDLVQRGISDEFYQALEAAVGAAHVVVDPKAMEPRLIEDRGLYRGSALALVRPGTTEEVAKVVRVCRAAAVPIVPQGGNTGLVGGGVPQDAVVLVTDRLNRIRAVDPLNSTMTVEAGCILSNIQQAANDIDRLFPLSLASEGSCQIGGNLSTNAGGTAVLRYGNMRELVLGLEVVLPDGEILNDLNGLRKNNTGYDLRNLFIGAEGTLGIITAAVLKLYSKPVLRATALVACEGPQAALALYDRLRSRNADSLSTFEYIERIALQMVLDHTPGCADPMAQEHPAYVLVELTSSDPEADLDTRLEAALAAAFEVEEILDAVIGASESQRDALWALRENLSEAQKFAGASIKHDVAVPVSRVAEFLMTASSACRAHVPAVRICPFGHFGDGNIHFNLSRPLDMSDADFLEEYPAFNRIVHDIVAELGGSISAEHGIGLVKRQELRRYKDPVALRVMEQIKTVLDPEGLMNPGKVL
ncbi:FAD-binding oxidoreductase [Paracoccus saliphilus]|uniref:FAD-binding oxidoreductase n=1 Tax=Paracoccus saliphilus TaxID=405559 RepID=A0AA45W0V2_9RHOB|nr:FAD-binding oxidoreductase [Paracoccus saliphilus]WCR03336.1 FAD-binding oxidoreductase [Paracoccus saliphilus]SIS51705.1 FAD/FMN-containing dehydrogenase [Paracoccus saliphilus]